MHQALTWSARIALVALAFAGSAEAGVSANQLENAYWKFDEGTNGATVPPGTANSVIDSSGNANHLKAFDAGTTPTYTSNVAPAPLRSGLPNTLALNFTANTGGAGGDDVYSDNKNINNGTIAAGGGYTLETAFRPGVVGGGAFQTLIVKEGQPVTGNAAPTLALTVRGDTGELQIEQFDGGGTLRSIASLNPLVADQWYAAAIVNDGSQLSLYLDSNDGNGYLLQGNVAVSGGALYQGGIEPPSWDKAWAIGHGQSDGVLANWYTGTIDEPRLSNRAITPSEFLFVPEPGSVALLAAGGLLLLRRRRV